MSFKGAIFDLDGVLVNTVPLHFRAWKKMFHDYGKGFDFEEYKKKVDGIPRLDGAKAILEDVLGKKLATAAAVKDRYYIELVKKEGAKAYKSAVSLIKELKKNKVGIAVISSSKNCHFISSNLNLYFLPFFLLHKYKSSSPSCIVHEPVVPSTLFPSVPSLDN